MTHHQILKIYNQICKRVLLLMRRTMMGREKMNNLYAKMKMTSFRIVMKLRVSVLMMKKLMIMNLHKLISNTQIINKKMFTYKLIQVLNQLIQKKRLKNYKKHKMFKPKLKKQLDLKKFKLILEQSFTETECIHQDVQASKKFQLNYLKLSLQNLNIKNKN